jgi:hypothetical protein
LRALTKNLKKHEKKIIGWRERVKLPDLDIQEVKAKVDTGAKTSTLHAYDIVYIKRGRKRLVRFKVHPIQNDTEYSVTCEAILVDMRHVRDSGGQSTLRPVISSTIVIGEVVREIELTLVNRDVMGFRMLIGRQALKGYFVVDVSKSFVR